MFSVVDQLPSASGVAFTMVDISPFEVWRAMPTAASLPVQPVPDTEKAVSEGLTMTCWSSANLKARESPARAGEAAREAPMAAAITLAAARGRPRRMSTPRYRGIGGNR